MLTDLYVIDLHERKVHRIGDEPHDSLYVWDGRLQYYNLQNGDGGGVKKESGAGYVILESESGSLVDEFGIIDKRFEKEIKMYLEERKNA